MVKWRETTRRSKHSYNIMTIISKTIGQNDYQQQNSDTITRNTQPLGTYHLNLTLEDIHERKT